MEKLKFLLRAILLIIVLAACGGPKNETIVDTENITVVLEKITTVIEEEWDNAYYELILNIENKSDETLNIRAEDITIDGLDVTNKVFFTEELASGDSIQTDLNIFLQGRNATT